MAASEDQRKTRQVLSLKIIFLKELKFTDLCRSLLKIDRSFVMILSFSFLLYKLRIAQFTK